MTSVYRKSVILFFTAIIVRIIFHYFTGFTADDAFITFRYAENLAVGEGYVYNIGQPVFGSSTPLFVFILSLFSLVSISPIIASFIISLAASGFTAMLLYRLAHHLRFTKFAVLPSLLYIFFPRVIPAETSGMETALFTFFIVTAFYLNRKNKNYYALAMATLAGLTRYEGFLVLLIIIIHIIYKDRDKFLYYLTMPLVMIIPWFVFTYFYFGSIIPHSVSAKLALYNLIGNNSIVDHFIYLMAFHNPIGYLLLIGSVFGAVWLNKKQNYGWLELFWLVGMILFYTFSKTHLFFWYVAPIYPLYLLFFSGAIVSLFDRLKFLQHKKYITETIIMLSVLMLVINLFYVGRAYKSEQAVLNNVHKKVGDYLYVHAGENDWVAAEDIGYIGYYSKRKILDRDGLVSTETVNYNRTGNYFGLIKDKKPDWVVLYDKSEISQFYKNNEFKELYLPVQEYESESGIRYIIYKYKKQIIIN